MSTERQQIHSYQYRLPRVRVDCKFWLQLDDGNATLQEARCTDIGEEGLAAELSCPLPPGTRVLIIFAAPGITQPLQISATVVYSREKLHGFLFTFSSDHERRAIEACVATLSTKRD